MIPAFWADKEYECTCGLYVYLLNPQVSSAPDMSFSLIGTKYISISGKKNINLFIIAHVGN